MRIPLGEWLPDIQPHENVGLTVAKNCLPYKTHYASFPGMTVQTNALAAPARGFFSARDSEGNAYSYAADSSALYRLSQSVFYDATRTSGAYSTDPYDTWEFAKWGDRCVATNFNNEVQQIAFGESNFTDLAGSPPRARHMAVVRNFLVLGNIIDPSTGEQRANKVFWSGFENIETWTPSASTQCDYQELQGTGGWIQRVVGGEYGLIVQERAIVRMTYVGSPLIFQFDEIPGFGTPVSASVIQIGNRVFYLGHEDFYMFTGAESTPIAHNRIFQTFMDDFDQDYAYRMVSGVHPSKPFVFWAYPNASATNGIPNRILVYNWLADRWAGPIELTVEALGVLQSESTTLEALDAQGTLETITQSFDSRHWMGNSSTLVAFDSAHKLNTISGDALTAVFETGDRQLTSGRKTLATMAIPLVEGGSASPSVAMSGRTKLTESASFGAAVAMNGEGECPIIAEGRYHRIRLNVAGGFSHATGVEIEGAPGGRY